MELFDAGAWSSDRRSGELHPVVKRIAVVLAIGAAVWAEWCTVIAFSGGTMPLLGWETEAVSVRHPLGGVHRPTRDHAWLLVRPASPDAAGDAAAAASIRSVIQWELRYGVGSGLEGTGYRHPHRNMASRGTFGPARLIGGNAGLQAWDVSLRSDEATMTARPGKPMRHLKAATGGACFSSDALPPAAIRRCLRFRQQCRSTPRRPCRCARRGACAR